MNLCVYCFHETPANSQPGTCPVCSQLSIPKAEFIAQITGNGVEGQQARLRKFNQLIAELRPHE